MLFVKRRKCLSWLACVVALCLMAIPAQAVENQGVGSYGLQAKLSCYVNAMGGVEFGEPLLEKAVLNIQEDGEESITLHLCKSSVTIYSVTCDTFVDANPGNTEAGAELDNGTIGYYDADGKLITDGVSYTLSEDTALNAANEAVRYVQSITFPIAERRETYALALYINSNVMGVQFGSKYAATLTVNWEADAGEVAEETHPKETAPEAEKMDGLFIYPAGTVESENPQTVVVPQEEQQGVPWGGVVFAAGLIFGGAVMVISTTGGKEDA